MKNRRFCWISRPMLALLAIASVCASAEGPRVPLHFSGLISDYTPVSGVSGPWEMRGEWKLEINRETGTADFSATLDMTHSDYWVVLNPASEDDNSAMGRHPHTHHVTISHAAVTPLAAGGFEITGPVYVTNDGNAAPFMAKCATSSPCTLTVQLVGGTVVPLSNLEMTFSGPPTTHFGTQAIHGVIRRPQAVHRDH